MRLNFNLCFPYLSIENFLLPKRQFLNKSTNLLRERKSSSRQELGKIEMVWKFFVSTFWGIEKFRENEKLMDLPIKWNDAATFKDFLFTFSPFLFLLLFRVEPKFSFIFLSLSDSVLCWILTLSLFVCYSFIPNYPQLFLCVYLLLSVPNLWFNLCIYLLFLILNDLIVSPICIQSEVFLCFSFLPNQYVCLCFCPVFCF